MRKAPLKRHVALRPLSREHHFALLLSWKIRRGLELGIDPIRIGRYVQKMWHHQLEEHFEIEERVVFPILGSDHEFVVEATADHRLFKRLILDEPFTIKTLNRIEERMEKHVRLEERQIFPLIQEKASEDDFKEISRQHVHEIVELDWDDQFWL